MWPEVCKNIFTVCVCPCVCVRCAGLQDENRLIHHPSWLCRRAKKAALWMWHCSPYSIKYSRHISSVLVPHAKSHHLQLLLGVADGVDLKTNLLHHEKERQISIKEERKEKAAECRQQNLLSFLLQAAIKWSSQESLDWDTTKSCNPRCFGTTNIYQIM